MDCSNFTHAQRKAAYFRRKRKAQLDKEHRRFMLKVRVLTYSILIVPYNNYFCLKEYHFLFTFLLRYGYSAVDKISKWTIYYKTMLSLKKNKKIVIPVFQRECGAIPSPKLEKTDLSTKSEAILGDSPKPLRPRIIRKRKRPFPDSPEKQVKEEKVEPPPKKRSSDPGGKTSLIRKYLKEASYGEMIMRSNLEKVRREVEALEKILDNN